MIESWELIAKESENHDCHVDMISERLRVTGGWVVRTIASRWKAGTAIAQTFIADVEGHWKPYWRPISKQGEVPHTEVLTDEMITPAGTLIRTVTSRYEAGVALEQTLLPLS